MQTTEAHKNQNFIAINLEDMQPLADNSVGWWAYFREDPTAKDLAYAINQLKMEFEILDEPIEGSNALSEAIGFKRYFIANFM